MERVSTSTKNHPPAASAVSTPERDSTVERAEEFHSSKEVSHVRENCSDRGACRDERVTSTIPGPARPGCRGAGRCPGRLSRLARRRPRGPPAVLLQRDFWMLSTPRQVSAGGSLLRLLLRQAPPTDTAD